MKVGWASEVWSNCPQMKSEEWNLIFQPVSANYIFKKNIRIDWIIRILYRKYNAKESGACKFQKGMMLFYFYAFRPFLNLLSLSILHLCKYSFIQKLFSMGNRWEKLKIIFHWGIENNFMKSFYIIILYEKNFFVKYSNFALSTILCWTIKQICLKKICINILVEYCTNIPKKYSAKYHSNISVRDHRYFWCNIAKILQKFLKYCVGILRKCS